MTRAQILAIIKKYQDKYEKLYGVRPNVRLRMSSRVFWYRGVTYDRDSRVVVTFGRGLDASMIHYIIVHELAHVLAGPTNNHNTVFYQSLWALVKAMKIDTDLVAVIADMEQSYKPRNSRKFAARAARITK